MATWTPPEDQLVHALVALRKANGMRQQDVAARIGISRSTVGNFETSPKRGDSPSLRTTARYAQALGVRLEFRMVS